MRIKNYFVLNVVIVSGALVAMSFLLFELLKIDKAALKIEQQDIKSFKLADQLRQSSDDLTRMVRTYAVTGKKSYKNYFDIILKIRNGEHPRPAAYQNIFWDFIIPGINDYKPSAGVNISLEALMQQANFTKEEFPLLKEAKENSDELVNLEREAMNALNGRFKDQNGDYTLLGKPDRELALKLLFGTRYHQAKSSIMAPIAEFTKKVSERNKHNQKLYEKKKKNEMMLIIALAIFLILFELIFIVYVYRRIMLPFDIIIEWAMRISRGNFSVMDKFKGNFEIDLLYRSFYGMTTSIHRTIYDLKKQKEMLTRSKEEAEKANNAKTVFLSNMTHDLRTPLNAVLGMTEILADKDVDDDIRDEALNSLKVGGESLLQIVNDILDLTKIESGKLELSYSPINIESFIQNIVDIYKIKVAEKKLKFEIDISKDLPELIKGDEHYLKRALANMISNAIKFTHKGFIQIRVYIYQEQVVFAVKDSGIGIAKESFEHILSPFSQEDSTTTRKFGGSGLGLAIVKHLASLMGGAFCFDSVKGEGSEFFFAIPLEDVQQKKVQADEVDADEISISKMRILLVDDSDHNRRIVRFFLKKFPVEIDEAENGKEAVDKYCQNYNQYDLIFMDLQMPVMSGYDAVRSIRLFESENSIKPVSIIALSASIMKSEVEESKVAGCDDHMAKPVKQHDIIRAVSRVSNKSN